MGRVVWELAAFNRETEELVGSWPLEGITPEEVKELFGLSVYDGGELEVTEEQVARLQQAVPHKIDLSSNAYEVGPTLYQS